MRAVMTAAIAVCLATGVTAATRQQAEARPADSPVTGTTRASREFRWDECRFGGLQRAPWTVREIVLTIRCAERRWPVPGGVPKALDVARCESGADLKDPGGDGYAGTFQQAERYWPGRWRAYNPRSWDKPLPNAAAQPRSNVVVSIQMAHARGWGADWSCA